MTLEERVASAVRSQTELLPPTIPDLPLIRASAKRQTRRRASLAVASAVVVLGTVVITAVTDIGPDRDTGIEPIGTPSPSPTTSTAPEPNASGWTRYRSGLYGFQIGHPSDWTEVPASRRWISETDVADALSPAHEDFIAPANEVRVSAWEAPLEAPAGSTVCPDLNDRDCVESIAFLEAWVEDYCEASGNTPCRGIESRAVELCLEKWDCHPGLLVPFRDDVQAFFSGGIYDADAMTVVAVWRGESDSSVAQYGGAQRLLESFLSTMEVWPASTPLGERR
jgi:hypothetical protein